MSSTSIFDEKSINDNAFLLQARPWHLDMDNLKVILNKKLVDILPYISTFVSGEICEDCEYVKTHPVPFDRSCT